MLRGAVGLACATVVALAATPSLAQNEAERGSPTQITVSIENERLRLDFSDGFTGPNVSVDYDLATDEWVVSANATLVAGPGCSISGEVRCPESGENVFAAMNSTPSDLTLAPADDELDFDSRIRLGGNSQGVTTADGRDVIIADDEGSTGSAGDEISTFGGDDEIQGSNSPDLINAGTGDDEISANSGDDIISGGGPEAPTADGQDTIAGGDGVDLVTYAVRTDDVVATIGATEEDTIAGDVEDLTGGLGNDTLTGNEDANFLRGGDDGADTFFGGSGTGPDGADTFRPGGNLPAIDTVSYANRKDAVTADIGGGADDVDGDDIGADIDDLTGGRGDDVLGGNDAPNTIIGGKGEDTMSSLNGADTINALDDGPDSSNCGDGIDTVLTDAGATETIANCETIDTAPETELTKEPQRRLKNKRFAFKFTSPTPGILGFECSFDGAVFTSCTSPQVERNIALGEHVFEVRAVDADGDRDPSPARAKFKRVERR